MKVVTSFCFGSGLAALAAALPQPAAPDAAPTSTASANNIIVSLERSITLGKEVVSVKTADHQILAYACGNKLTFAGIDIEVKADDETQGTMKLGGEEFPLDEAGYLTCGGHWNTAASVVECEVPWTQAWDDLKPLSEDSGLECISDGTVPTEDVRDSVFVEETAEAADEIEPPVDTTPAPEIVTGLEKRQCQPATEVEVPKNRTPRKWGKYIQVTDKLYCNDGWCAAGYNQEVSVTHKTDISLGFSSWASGGYSVTKTRTNSQTMTCGGNAGQTVCVWSWLRYQAYDARKRQRHRSCTADAWSKWYRITSPLTGSKGNHSFSCYRGGNCWKKWDVQWVNRGDGEW